MSNTQTRILSALVLLLILGFAAMFKTQGLSILLLVSGIFLVDEFVHNLLRVKRNHMSYALSMLSYAGGYVLFNYLDPAEFYFDYFIHTGAALNTVLIAYLFFEPSRLSLSLE